MGFSTFLRVVRPSQRIRKEVYNKKKGTARPAMAAAVAEMEVRCRKLYSRENDDETKSP